MWALLHCSSTGPAILGRYCCLYRSASIVDIQPLMSGEAAKQGSYILNVLTRVVVAQLTADDFCIVGVPAVVADVAPGTLGAHLHAALPSVLAPHQPHLAIGALCSV